MRYEHADYKDTDDRGRVTLGTEHANSTVAIAWVELEKPTPGEAEEFTPAQADTASDLFAWGSKHGYNVLDVDVSDGRIYTNEAEWVDTDVAGLADE